MSSPVRKLLRGHRPILVDFVPEPRPRWGHGRPPQPELVAWLERERDAYRERLVEIAAFRELLQRIPAHGTPETGEPYWINDFMPGLDAAALYTFVARRSPANYVELGSGHSTRFAARAVRDHGLHTQIVTLDPTPRAAIEGLSSRNLSTRLEDADPALIATLVERGDILFFDGSHRAFENSDVTAFFLDVLPRLRSGVLVQIHDICLPFDYPPGWEDRWYSEQYVLAAYILGGGARMKAVLPNAYVSADEELHALTDAIWDAPGLGAVVRGGSSFWFEVT